MSLIALLLALRHFHTLNDWIENDHLIFARIYIVQTIVFHLFILFSTRRNFRSFIQLI